MALDVFPGRAPDYPMKKKTTPRVLQANLGEGYSERAGDGINSIQHLWSPAWTNLTAAEANTIEDFFEGKSGYVAFTWTDRRNATWKILCKGWERTDHSPGYSDMSAEWEQVFDIG